MSKYFVSNGTIVTAPSDSNDGLDAIGFGITGMAYDDLGHIDGDYRLYDSGSGFSSYTHTAGDQIYLTGYGLFTIDSKVSSDVIILTESMTGGGDASAVASATGPWATLQHGADTVAAGNICVICGASTYAMSAAWDFDTQAADAPDRIWYVGANARGVIDDTRATIDFATQTSGNGIHGPSTVAVENLVFSNFNILNADDHGVFIDVAAHWVMTNCRVSGSGQNGVQLDSGAAGVYMYGCEIDDNTIGINTNGSTRGPIETFECSVHDNSSHGILYAGEANHLSFTRIYDNGGAGVIRRTAIPATYARYGLTLTHCTVQGNTNSGVDLFDSSYGRATFLGTIFRSNGAYGIDAAGNDEIVIVAHCCFHNNTSGPSDVTLPDGGGNIYVDPEFESEVDGSEDFEPDSDSPLIGAGCSWSMGGGTQYLDIGAIQREMAAGGGGSGGGQSVLGGGVVR